LKLLLHICCGPCSVYPVSVLQEEEISFEGLYYNPNIHPYDEFLRRKENVGIVAGLSGYEVHYMDDFMQEEWENFDKETAERCMMCYDLRLKKTAEFAKNNGFDSFTSTLLVSPYQNHDLIKELGEKYSDIYGISFYYKDFREGFRKGQQNAKEMGLYRQRYCGCIKSLNNKG
jgi:epoxyqueuosine reductase